MGQEKILIVCLHDIAPLHEGAVCEIYRRVYALIGKKIVSAVVPDWHHGFPLVSYPHFVRRIERHSGEIILHGYSHKNQRHQGAVYFLTGGADEMSALDKGQVQERLRDGQKILERCFSRKARGFVPPAWQSGTLTREILARHGFEYKVGYTAVEYVKKGARPLNTWSWECDRFGALGFMGTIVGKVLSQWRPHGIPTIVFHPNDLKRGFVRKGLGMIRNFLKQGYRPVTFEEMASVFAGKVGLCQDKCISTTPDSTAPMPKTDAPGAVPHESCGTETGHTKIPQAATYGLA
ncbi:MAG: DUF2334 domain-containing protein [Candidatus Omnitrophota bacterium]|nr:DUF2334 domain-containing protein [Candidatus Omnitrophota bacterium]MDZ4242510.1 DUF2334 domain-containing protein [Candidatus Omnitrophota bacterium]